SNMSRLIIVALLALFFVASSPAFAAPQLSGIGGGGDETLIIARIIAPLANYVRNPTENLLKELEPLLPRK
ncbi:hypothetical protein PFISCL1PPCAC_17909, partial [Pristionchus fissidentatus]